MKVLLCICGSGIDVLSLYGPIMALREANSSLKIDVMMPKSHFGELAGHPAINAFLFTSNFGIPDSYQWRKIPSKITHGLSKGYSKIIDCSLASHFPTLGKSISISDRAGLYAKIWSKYGLATSHVDLEKKPEATSHVMPIDYDRAVLIEEFTPWHKEHNIRSFCARIMASGFEVWSRGDIPGARQLPVSSSTLLEIAHRFKKIITTGGFMSGELAARATGDVLHWSDQQPAVNSRLVSCNAAQPDQKIMSRIFGGYAEAASDDKTDNSLYSDLTDEQFLLRQFSDFCGRRPQESEMHFHMQGLKKKTRAQVNDEFAYCDEVVRRAMRMPHGVPKLPAVTKTPGDFRVAIILAGHLRTFKKTYPVIRSKFVIPLGADVFIHTWDNIGMQKVDPKYGPIADESEQVDISEIYKIMPEAVDVKIENNASFVATSKMSKSKAYVFGAGSAGSWKMVSAKPVFIESQLYSVYSAFQLMQRQEEKLGKKYDLVIKLRSDMEVGTILPVTTDLQPSDLYVPSPPNNNHGHPVCYACESGPHEGRHACDVCDVYAYGGSESMAHYCSLWNNLEEVYGRMCLENEVNLKHPGALYGMCDGHVAVPIWHNGATHRLHCFFPERIFRLYLEGWHLKKGHLQCKIVR